MNRERDRQDLAAFRAEEERLARAAEEQRMRPVRQAAAELGATHGKLLALERRILSGEISDPNPFVSDELKDTHMSQASAVAFTTGAFGDFFADHPDFYASDANGDALTRYFARNGITVLNAEMIAHVVERMRVVGMLDSAPELPAPVEAEQFAPGHETTPSQPLKPELYEGIDPETGESKVYTRWQMERMSSHDFKRCRIRF